jgi:hypothetical protein
MFTSVHDREREHLVWRKRAPHVIASDSVAIS